MDARLRASAGLNGAITAAEVLGGIASGSVSLLSDAVHNASDVMAVVLAPWARRLGRRAPTARHTYGFRRAEVVAALANAVTLIVVTALIAREAVQRLLHPEPVARGVMLAVALGAFVANVASVFLLRRHREEDSRWRRGGSGAGPGALAAARSRSPALLLAASLVVVPAVTMAGPPYATDDPEPVAYHHWEFSLATQQERASDGSTGTAPHVEVNFGEAPNLQLHLIAPLAYARPSGGPTAYGAGDVELGAKVRFVEESASMPMAGVFPLVELPTGSESRGLGGGHVRAFIPLWLQKSFAPWMTYGGGGYWINPGAGNRDYWYVGWQLQRHVTEIATVGGEVFYTTPDRASGDGNLAFNVGLVLDFTEHHHVLPSAGRSIAKVGESGRSAGDARRLSLEGGSKGAREGASVVGTCSACRAGRPRALPRRAGRIRRASASRTRNRSLDDTWQNVTGAGQREAGPDGFAGHVLSPRIE